MATAGTVTVDFAAQTAKFTAELKKVRSDLAVLKRDSATVSQALGKFGDTVRGLVTLGAVVATVRSVIRATAEAEAAQAQLNSALAAAGANVKAASAEFQAYATSLQRTTTYGDEAILQVSTLLLSFAGLSGEIVKRATPAVLDLSARMGIDAASAAKLLGKALADPIGGLGTLSRSGVIFTAQQKDQIKALVESGRALEAQGVILRSLEGTFGGAAVAARDTFGGALAGLNNALGDLAEGGSGFNAASDAINGLTDVLSSPQTKQAFQDLISGLAHVIRLSAEAASGLALIFRGGDGDNEQVNIDNRIRKLQDERAAIARELDTGGPRGLVTGPTLEFYSEDQRNADLARIAEIDGQIRALQVQWEEAQERARQTQAYGTTLGRFGVGTAGAATGALDFVTGGEPEEGMTEAAKKAAEERQRVQERIADFIYRNEQDLLTSIIEDGRELVAAEQVLEVERIENDLQQRLQIEQDAANQRFEIESDLQSRLQDLRAGAANAAVGLLQFLAQRSRAAAIALILVNKGLAISQAVQNTAAAATKALAIYGPTPQGYAAAASAKAFGALQIGLIAATGALEIASVRSGGGGPAVAPGSPNNPIYTRGGEEDQSRGVASSPSVIVNITGVVTQDVLDELFDGIAEKINGQDRILVGSRSRQALELREA